MIKSHCPKDKLNYTVPMSEFLHHNRACKDSDNNWDSVNMFSELHHSSDLLSELVGEEGGLVLTDELHVGELLLLHQQDPACTGTVSQDSLHLRTDILT